MLCTWHHHFHAVLTQQDRAGQEMPAGERCRPSSIVQDQAAKACGSGETALAYRRVCQHVDTSPRRSSAPWREAPTASGTPAAPTITRIRSLSQSFVAIPCRTGPPCHLPSVAVRGTRLLQCMATLTTWRLVLETWRPYRFAPLPMAHRRGHLARGSNTRERGVRALGTMCWPRYSGPCTLAASSRTR